MLTYEIESSKDGVHKVIVIGANGVRHDATCSTRELARAQGWMRHLQRSAQVEEMRKEEIRRGFH